jgi:hypothetical protein
MKNLEATPINVSWVRLDADEIEQRIIRAYVQLACIPRKNDGSRSLTVARLTQLDVRLTEALAEMTGMPLFWLEVYSDTSHSVIDRYECSDFDEDDLATAVQMIMTAGQRAHDLRH